MGLLALTVAIGLVAVVPILFHNAGPLTADARAKGMAAENRASLPSAWTNWKYFRAIQLSSTSTARLISVTVPPEVYTHSANRLADLRVIDDFGAEVPYLLQARFGSQQSTEQICRMQEKSFVPGKYSQFICDSGESQAFHNGVLVETLEQNFMAWADVAVSDDAREWRIVNDRSPIYSFTGRNLAGVNTLRYGETNARYIRVRIFRTDRQFAVNSLVLLHEESETKETAPISATVGPEHGNFPGESVWRADLGWPGLPVDEVGVETTQPEFSRRVTAQSSNDGVNWTSCGGGDVYRFQQGGSRKESLRIGLYNEWASSLRIYIANGDDPPLEGLRVTLYLTPRRLFFRQLPGRGYTLLYGQSEAHAPQYDIAQTLNIQQTRAAQPAASVGAEETNLGWTDPRPWTDRNSAVLWVAAILAALLLAYVALRSLRPPAPRQN